MKLRGSSIGVATIFLELQNRYEKIIYGHPNYLDNQLSR